MNKHPYVRAVAGHTAVHYGSHRHTECGLNDTDGTLNDSALTLVPGEVTCRTCRGWLPIVVWPAKAEDAQ